ncbi:hypothetical protein LMG33818_002151 [Halomonadaceae bacterium LMG 33818]
MNYMHAWFVYKPHTVNQVSGSPAIWLPVNGAEEFKHSDCVLHTALANGR